MEVPLYPAIENLSFGRAAALRRHAMPPGRFTIRFGGTCSLTRGGSCIVFATRKFSKTWGLRSFNEAPGNSIKVVASFARLNRSYRSRGLRVGPRFTEFRSPVTAIFAEFSSPPPPPDLPTGRETSVVRWERSPRRESRLLSRRHDAKEGRVKWPDEWPGQSWKVGRVRVDGTWTEEGEARRTEVVARV